MQQQQQRYYGLTQETLKFYRLAVEHGFSFDRAMEQLRELYEHNKVFYVEEYEWYTQGRRRMVALMNII